MRSRLKCRRDYGGARVGQGISMKMWAERALEGGGRDDEESEVTV